MPKLRRLSGADVVKILGQFEFVVVRIRGSHHVMRRVVNGETQTVNIPVHGSKILGPGMLKRLYRDTSRYLSEDQLRDYFYAE